MTAWGKVECIKSEYKNNVNFPPRWIKMQICFQLIWIICGAKFRQYVEEREYFGGVRSKMRADAFPISGDRLNLENSISETFWRENKKKDIGCLYVRLQYPRDLISSLPPQAGYPFKKVGKRWNKRGVVVVGSWEGRGDRRHTTWCLLFNTRCVIIRFRAFPLWCAIRAFFWCYGSTPQNRFPYLLGMTLKQI